MCRYISNEEKSLLRTQFEIISHVVEGVDPKGSFLFFAISTAAQQHTRHCTEPRGSQLRWEGEMRVSLWAFADYGWLHNKSDH